MGTSISCNHLDFGFQVLSRDRNQLGDENNNMKNKEEEEEDDAKKKYIKDIMK